MTNASQSAPAIAPRSARRIPPGRALQSAVSASAPRRRKVFVRWTPITQPRAKEVSFATQPKRTSPAPTSASRIMRPSDAHAAFRAGWPARERADGPHDERHDEEEREPARRTVA